jgi:hypothetical protein
LTPFHNPLLKDLQIPWTFEDGEVKPPTKLYRTCKFATIYWYCPWETCYVKKKWVLYHGQQWGKKGPCKPASVTKENFVTHSLYSQFKKDFLSNPSKYSNTYVVFEYLCDEHTHTHAKGCVGGSRIKVDTQLYTMDEIRRAVSERGNYLEGKLLQVLAKSITPLVKMAQAITNQPLEAFVGGFTDCIPHNLASFQKDSSILRKNMLNEFGITDPLPLRNSLPALMELINRKDKVKRESMIKNLSITANKYVCGYIQRLLFTSQGKFAAICFNESQFLLFLLHLKNENAIMWDGTEPNTQKNSDDRMTMMFTVAF